MKKEEYRRLNLKNGWDLPKGEKPPLTGRKQELIRAYELLVAKTDEAYLAEAEDASRTKQTESAIRRDGRDAGDDTGTEVSERAQTVTEEMPESLYEPTDEGWKKRRKKKALTGLSIVAAVAVVFGLRLLIGGPILIADISNYADVPITIEGLTPEAFEVTPKEISKMKKEMIRVDVHEEELGPDDVEELGRALGPTVETFLKNYDVSLDEIRSMKVYAENDKSTAYVHTLEDSEVILSVANGRKPLGAKEAPLRIAVKDTDAGEWSGWIRRIVFTRK